MDSSASSTLGEKPPQAHSQSGVVICTGAAGGMGRATAEAFGRQGRDLVLCDLKQPEATIAAIQSSSPHAHIKTVTGDISDPAYPDKVIEALGGRKISVLVNSAGVSPGFGNGPKVFDINFTSAVRLVDKLRPHMERDTGAVIMVASLGGTFIATSLVDLGVRHRLKGRFSPTVWLMSRWSYTSYAISKRCTQMYVRSMATEMARDGLRILSVSPGVFDTAMMTDFSDQPALKTFVASSGLGRMGKPEEVAAVVEFLASPMASYCTGTDMLVDGGLTAQKGHAIKETIKALIENPPWKGAGAKAQKV